MPEIDEQTLANALGLLLDGKSDEEIIVALARALPPEVAACVAHGIYESVSPRNRSIGTNRWHREKRSVEEQLRASGHFER